MAYYNKLKDTLRQESGLPEGYEWDSVKQGIFNKMPQKKKRRNGILFFLLGILCLGGILGLILTQNEDKPSQKPDNKVVVQKIDKTDESNHINIDSNENIETVIKPSNTESNKTESQTTSGKQDIINPSHPVSKQQKFQKISEIPARSFATTNQSIVTETDSGTAINPSNNVTLASAENIIGQGSESEKLNPETHKETKYFSAMTSLPTLTFNVLTTKESVIDIPKHTAFIKPANKSFIIAKDICFGGGTVLWNRQQKNDQIFSSAGHNATVVEKELPGLSAFVRADLFTSRNIFVSTGLDYQLWYSDYFYDGTKTEIKNVNVVTTIEHNLISGINTGITEHVSRNVTEKRKFRNRNEISLLQLPLLLGYQYNLSKWYVKSSIGPVFTIHTGGSGKKLIGNDIAEYSGISPDLKSRFVVSAGAQFNVGYVFSPSWFVCAQASWFKSLQNTVNQEATVDKPSFVGLGLGAGYVF